MKEMDLLKERNDKIDWVSLRNQAAMVNAAAILGNNEMINRIGIRSENDREDIHTTIAKCAIEHADSLINELKKLQFLKQGEQKPDIDFSDLRTWKYIVDAVWTEKEGIGQYLDSPFTEEVAKKLQKRFGKIEQKPADKVESKFKVGDTIIKKHNSDILYFGSFVITDITGGKYWYNDRIICDITEQDEWEIYEPVSQKSAEWSEEDDEHLERILKELESQRQRPFNRPYLDKIESDYNWLESLKDRVQPKQEWSEEDEKTIHLACEFIRHRSERNGSIGGINYSELINRLRFIIPQNRWKPSEEQMNMLEKFITFFDVGRNGKEILRSLYSDLKKLTI